LAAFCYSMLRYGLIIVHTQQKLTPAVRRIQTNLSMTSSLLILYQEIAKNYSLD